MYSINKFIYLRVCLLLQIPSCFFFVLHNYEVLGKTIDIGANKIFNFTDKSMYENSKHLTVIKYFNYVHTFITNKHIDVAFN